MKKLFGFIPGIVIATLIFAGTLFFLLRTFVKKPEASPDVTIHKHYDYIREGKPEIHQTFYLAPFMKSRIWVTRGKDVLYDQIYESDEFMFRIPMVQKKDANFHALFAGCSFAWGEGVPENHTVASYFQEMTPGVQSYNHGFPGGGLHTLIHYNKTYKLNEIIRQKEGRYFYIFIPSHLDRFHARYNFIVQNPEYSPHYGVVNGKVVYKGFLRDQTPYKVFWEAYKAGLGDTLIKTQDPMKWSDQELREYVMGVEYLKDQYKKQFPSGRFVFVFHPLGANHELNARMMKFLDERRIKYVDPSGEFGDLIQKNNVTYEDMSIRYDGHPTAMGNEYLVRSMIEAFKKVDQNQK